MQNEKSKIVTVGTFGQWLRNIMIAIVLYLIFRSVWVSMIFVTFAIICLLPPKKNNANT